MAHNALVLSAKTVEVEHGTFLCGLMGIDQLNQLMASLVTTREVLAKIPTWPWETGTLTGFISAFLPFAIGLIGVLLEQYLF